MESNTQNIELILTAIPELRKASFLNQIPSANPRLSKYQIEDASGDRCVLYLADKKDYSLIKQTFHLIKMLHENKILVPQALCYGVSEKNLAAYLVTGWLEGQPAGTFLPDQHEVSQYLLGQETAIFINSVHACSVDTESNGWSCYIGELIGKLASLAGPAVNQDVLRLLDFVRQNQDLTLGRPQSVLYGQLLVDNLFCAPGSCVGLPNWENWQYGDPLADLASLVTDMRKVSDFFVTGFLDCYFSYKVDVKSFHCLAFYAALHMLKKYQAADAKERVKIARDIKAMNREYSNFSSVVPKWYKPLPRINLARVLKKTDQ